MISTFVEKNEKELGSGLDTTKRSRAIKIFFVVASYWTISISLVFINKSLLNSESKKDNFHVPFFVTWFQCVVSVTLLFLLHQCKVRCSIFNDFPDLTFRLNECVKVMTSSIMFVLMVTFSNLCLLYIGISFYNVARSLSTVFNVVCSYLILGTRTSIPAMFCCSVIISGFLLGNDQENVLGSFNMLGSTFGVLGSLFVSLNGIFIKKMLPVVDHNIWKLIYYNNINAAFLFVPLIIASGEPNTIMESVVSTRATFWRDMMVGGVLGLVMGYISGLQIEVTSPLTHNVSQTSKGALQTVIATNVNPTEAKNLLWWISNVIALVGSLAYSTVRYMEMKK